MSYVHENSREHCVGKDLKSLHLVNHPFKMMKFYIACGEASVRVN